MTEFYWHPLFIHFPIAFFLLELILLLRWKMKNRQGSFRLSVGCLKLGYYFSIPVMISGYIDGGGYASLFEIADIRNHFLLSLAAFLLYTGRIIHVKFHFPTNRKQKNQHALLALLAYLVMVVAGLLGGKLVYS